MVINHVNFYTIKSISTRKFLHEHGTKIHQRLGTYTYIIPYAAIQCDSYLLISIITYDWINDNTLVEFSTH